MLTSCTWSTGTSTSQLPSRPARTARSTGTGVRIDADALDDADPRRRAVDAEALAAREARVSALCRLVSLHGFIVPGASETMGDGAVKKRLRGRSRELVQKRERRAFPQACAGDLERHAEARLERREDDGAGRERPRAAFVQPEGLGRLRRWPLGQDGEGGVEVARGELPADEL